MILPAALWKLIGLQRKARYRRMLRGMKTARGALFVLLGFCATIGWAAPRVYLAFAHDRTDGTRVHLFLPLTMIGLCAMNLFSSAGERAIAFLPAEADFLFPGPFTRRQLLAYKLMQNVIGISIASIFFSFFWLQHAHYWVNSWAGYLLAMLFVQLLSMAVVLLSQTVGERATVRGRNVLKIGSVILLAALVYPRLRQTQDVDLPQMFDQVRQSPVGRAVFAPFDVFASIITARSIFPEAIKFVGIAVAMIGLLLATVMWLDADYAEVAAAAGTRLHAKLKRMRRGGGLTSGGPSQSAAWLRLPMPPRLGGIGPIAWRQTVSAFRQSRGVFVFVGIVCTIGIVALSVSKNDDKALQIISGGLFWITMVLVESLRFDFRGDVDRIDTLRALPMNNHAIVVAELIAPTAVLAVAHALVLGFAVAFKKLPPIALPLGFLIALPVDLIVVQVENLMFLLFPSRRAEGAAGDMQGAGRRVIGLIAKITAVGILLGLAALFAMLVRLFIPDSPYLVIAAGAVFALVETTALIPVLAFAFSKFDPSVDAPIE